MAFGHLSEPGQEAAGVQPVSALGPQVLSQQAEPVPGLQVSPCFFQPMMCHTRDMTRDVAQCDVIKYN